MAIDTSTKRWRKFRDTFHARPLYTWEFYAPRSGWLTPPDVIYKLFVRPRPQTASQNQRWWMFEDEITWVDPHYPRWYYEQVKPVRTVSGPISHLIGLRPERHLYMRPALERAVDFIQYRIASDDPVRLRAAKLAPELSPLELAELAVLEETAKTQRDA